MIHSSAWLDERGKLLHAEGPILPIYSITKTVIASIVLDLALDLSTPISRWIDASLVPASASITLEHLLTHTSGLRDYGALPEYQSAVGSGAPIWTDEEFADRTLRQPLLFAPGQGWAYSNPGYWLLVEIARRASGCSLDELVQTFVAGRLDLESFSVARGIFSERLPSYPAGWVWHGLVLATAHDVARFIASPLAARLVDHLVRVPFAVPHWSAPHYGLGVMVDSGLRYGHSGGGPGFTSACYRFLDSGLTGCLVASTDAEEDALSLLLQEHEMRRSSIQLRTG